ncbi:MAG: ribonuclease J [Epsilonproteobacteria bacterium]|nr:ribonuclease J [Campylobacterota bacterium]
MTRKKTKLSLFKKGELNIVPLGGLSEIGLNCTVLEYAGVMIVVDAGLMFPGDNMHGVDYVIPDLSYLTKNAQKIKAIFVTHGHEDHTGAIPYILQNINVPVYGTGLTIGLIAKKLQEFKALAHPKLITIKPREKVKIGKFLIEPIRVTHSIIDAVSYGIKTPAGTAIITGDFKIDMTPVGEKTDFDRFSAYGAEGVDILLSDSTNSLRSGHTPSEKLVGEAFENIFPKITGRILVVTFASNINRIQQVVDVAIKNGRKICITGKSMVKNCEIAEELGYLNIPKASLIDVKSINAVNDNSIAIITTGSQGEPMSVLSRIVNDEHKTIKAKHGDTVIISSNAIPGNERSVSAVVNMLYEKGVDVVYEENAFVHVSGHGSSDELKMIMSLTKPKNLFPVHGEYRMRARLAELAKQMGIDEKNIIMAGNGDVVTLNAKGEAKITGKITTGKIFIKERNAASVDINIIKQRNKLAANGIVFITIRANSRADALSAFSRSIGFLTEDSFKAIKNSIESRATNKYLKLLEENNEYNSILMKVNRDISKFISKKTGFSPFVETVIFRK